MQSLFGFFCVLVFFLARFTAANDRPIIGILAQETDNTKLSKKYGPSQILASYVKFIESAGARVVPIKIKQEDSYYRRLVRKLNGILLPGGGAKFGYEEEFDDNYGYGKAARKIYEFAKERNKEKYFPLWGTCLGMEFLVVASNNYKRILTSMTYDNESAPITLSPDYLSSKVFGQVTESLKEKMEKENSFAYFHKMFLTQKKFDEAGLGNILRVVATGESKKDKGFKFISVIEDKRFPFYGVQFHPEKPVFEWSNRPSYSKLTHTSSAVQITQYLADFFVDECRKNDQNFTLKAEENKYLIYNCNPLWLEKKEKKNLTITQSYFFSTDDDEKFCIHEN